MHWHAVGRRVNDIQRLGHGSSCFQLLLVVKHSVNHSAVLSQGRQWLKQLTTVSVSPLSLVLSTFQVLTQP